MLQKKEFKDAVESYRSALALQPGDADTRRNMEIALRAIEEQRQKEQEKHRQESEQEGRERRTNSTSSQQEQNRQNQAQKQEQQPQTQEEKEQERWKQETGMPKEQAMQLLSALEQSEKAEQKKQLAALRAGKKKGKDW